MQKSKKNTIQLVAIIVLSLLLVLAIALGASGAWFQDTDNASGTITMSDPVMIKLQQNGADLETANTFNFEAEEVLPGASIAKPITFIKDNDVISSAWVRVKLLVTGNFTPAIGIALPDTFVHNATETADTDWYYYNSSWTGDAVTLIGTLTVPEELTNAVANQTVTISIYVQAIQSEHTGESAVAADWSSLSDAPETPVEP